MQSLHAIRRLLEVGQTIRYPLHNIHKKAAETIRTYGPSSKALDTYLAKHKQYHYDDVIIADALEHLATALRAGFPNTGVIDGSYAYWPANKKLTRWTASDGSDFKASLLQIALEYSANGSTGQSEVMDAAIDHDLGRVIITKKVNQQDYEGGKMQGDWQ